MLCVRVPHALVSLTLTLVSTAVFACTVLLVGLWTHYHGPIRFAKQVMQWNNRVYAVASLVMLGWIVQFSVLRLQCRYHPHDHGAESGTEGLGTAILKMRLRALSQLSYFLGSSDSPAVGGWQKAADTAVVDIPLAPLVYHLSKFYEYFDIVLVLANHGPRYRSLAQQPIDLHFGFHHLTTPYLTWFRMIQSSDPGWEVFAGLNCFHHVIMYSFFAGGWCCIGLRPETLRKILPWTGGLQLVAGIAMEGQSLVAIWNHIRMNSFDNDCLGHLVALGLLSSYLVLYTRDMRMRAIETASPEEKKLN